MSVISKNNSFEKIKQKLLEFDIFVDNEYLNKYVELIVNNSEKKFFNEYTETHHILQRSYFKKHKLKLDNSDNNLIKLSLADHILAHYYLCFCTKNGYDVDNSIAFIKMSGLYYKNIEEKDLIKIYPKIIEARQKMTTSLSKKVFIYDQNGSFIKRCENAKKAKEYMQDNYNIKINECEINSCASPLSKRLSCKNFIFLREEESIEDRLQLIKKDIYLNRKRKINVYDLNGCFINSFDSVKECSLFFTNKTGEKYFSQNITSCAKGVKNKYKEYIFLYDKDSIIQRLNKINNDIAKEDERINLMKKKVYIYNFNGELIEEAQSSVHAQTIIREKTLDCKYLRAGISRCCSGESLFYKDYVFLYQEESFKDRYNKILNNNYCLGRISKKQQ